MSVNNRYSPYALPRTDDEARAYYQALYGFRTQGAHLGLVRQLLGDAHHACPTCKGAGLYGTYGGLGALNCPACRGLGVAYTISLDELEKRRRQIIDRYPGAAIPNWQPYRPIRLPVVDPATGIVFDAAPGGPEPIQLELAFS
jgi:hypothetical protein